MDHTFLVSTGFGNFMTSLGVFIALIGFAITIWQVIKSGAAAKKAEDAVVKVQEDIRKVNTVADFSAALTIMDEIKRLHRESAWIILPDRYSELRKLLISIKTSNPELPTRHRSKLQGAIQHFASMEQQRTITTYRPMQKIG